MKIHAPNITGSLVGNISGSITSTGSFGRVEATTFSGDGSGLSNLPASFTSAGISGSWQGQNFSTTQSFSDGTATKISGSSVSTGSFGHIMKGGVNWDTAVSTSAATAGFGGGGSDDTSWQDGTATLFSGSAFSTASFGRGGLTVDNGNADLPFISRKWDIIDFTFNDEKDVSALGSKWGFTFSSDGNRMYIGDASSDAIVQYELSSSWDVGSANDNPVSHSINKETSNGTGYQFKTDGMSLYVGDKGSDKIYQYTLTVPWDVTSITTGSTDTLVKSGSVGDLPNIETVFIRNDGKKVYTIDQEEDVEQYRLTTPWDISTLTHEKRYDIGNEETDARTLFFKPDGTRMYAGKNVIWEYELSSSWDIGTAKYSGYSASFTSKNSSLQDIHIKPDGSKIYTLDYSNQDVYEWTFNRHSGSIDIGGDVDNAGSLRVHENLDIYGKVTGYNAEFKGNISGSITSTGSFGKVVGDGSGLTKLQRPITTHTTHFTSSMDYAGHYNIVGGNLTCSILAEATASTTIGTEWEFFQTSSAGTMLFQSASLVNVYSKDGAMTLTGQYSAATLKKTATNTWHLVGDLA